MRIAHLIQTYETLSTSKFKMIFTIETSEVDLHLSYLFTKLHTKISVVVNKRSEEKKSNYLAHITIKNDDSTRFTQRLMVQRALFLYLSCLSCRAREHVNGTLLSRETLPLSQKCRKKLYQSFP